MRILTKDFNKDFFNVLKSCPSCFLVVSHSIHCCFPRFFLKFFSSNLYSIPFHFLPSSLLPIQFLPSSLLLIPSFFAFMSLFRGLFGMTKLFLATILGRLISYWWRNGKKQAWNGKYWEGIGAQLWLKNIETTFQIIQRISNILQVFPGTVS